MEDNPKTNDRDPRRRAGADFRYTPGLGFWTSDNDGLEEPEWVPADQEIAEEMVEAAKVWLDAKEVKVEL